MSKTELLMTPAYRTQLYDPGLQLWGQLRASKGGLIPFVFKMERV